MFLVETLNIMFSPLPPTRQDRMVQFFIARDCVPLPLHDAGRKKVLRRHNTRVQYRLYHVSGDSTRR